MPAKVFEEVERQIKQAGAHAPRPAETATVRNYLDWR